MQELLGRTTRLDIHYKQLDADHLIECKLTGTPATRSPQLKYACALCDPVILTYDLLT